MSETKSKESYQKNNLIVIGGQWALKSCIYRGKTHNWYLALNQSQTGMYFIVRLVMQEANTNIDSIQEEEKLLKKMVGLPQVPTIIASGDTRLQNTNYYFQVFEKYGPSLKLCFQFVNQEFSLATVSMIAIQILSILEKVHQQSLIHRNLKPKKILTLPNKNELLLIDFKCSSKYKHKNGKYIGYTSKFSAQSKLTKYSSLNQHLGLTASPKDDLESLGFMLIYFLKKGDMFKNKDNGPRNKQMEDQKLRMIPEKFCKDMPLEILQYFQYVRMTNVQQYPLGDYEFLKKLFRNILVQQNIQEKDFQYDWIKKMNQQANTNTNNSPLQQQQQNNNNINQQSTATKIIIHQPQNLEGIQEVQTELERSSVKKDFFRQYSSLQVSDEEDIQFESVSAKMLHLPNMIDFIKLKH